MALDDKSGLSSRHRPWPGFEALLEGDFREAAQLAAVQLIDAGVAQQLLRVGAARRQGTLGGEPDEVVEHVVCLLVVRGGALGIAPITTRVPLRELDLELGRVQEHEAGELGGPAVGSSEGSGAKVTRAERKKATREANKAGKLARPGVTNAEDDAIRAEPTTASRAERKAQTRAANKSRKLAPAGETK